MGKAFEIVAGRVTNPGATFTALTANTGNTFAVRAFDNSSTAWLENVWGQEATKGAIRIRSPKMHDAVNGLRWTVPAAVIRGFMADPVDTRLYSTDTLTVEMSGGAAEIDAGAYVVYYDDLPGIDAQLGMWDTIKPSIVDLVTVPVSVTGPTTSGDWSAGNTINSLVDTLKADTKYAILGYQCDTESLAVAIAGPDTGNLRVGGPGCVEPIETRSWFVRDSGPGMRPHIPVINSNNRGGTLVSVAKVGAGGTVAVELTLAELTR